MTDLNNEDDDVIEITSSAGSKSASDDEDLVSETSSKSVSDEESGSDEEESGEDLNSDDDDDESSSEAESMTEDSVFGAFEQEKAQSQEAVEAKIVQEFQTSLHLLANGDKAKAKTKFKKLLSNPLVGCFHTDEYDWEKSDTKEETHSKMAKVFVGAHKNLATLEPEAAVDHYCQILSVNSNNPNIWVDVALKCVEKGDLHFAQYALQRANNDASRELLIDVLYLSKQYHECLKTIKLSIDLQGSSNKFLFMKMKIRGINNHFREFCNDIFSDSPYYETDEHLPENVIAELTDRFNRAEEKQRLIVEAEQDKEMKILEPIEIPIEAEYSLTHVLTIFCDMFDRIESYSSLVKKKLRFTNWEPRSDYLDLNSSINEMIDVVITMEDLISEIDMCCDEPSTSKGKDKNKHILPGVRRIARRIHDVESCDEEMSDLQSRESTVTQDSAQTSASYRLHPKIRNTLGRRLGLQYTTIQPLLSVAHAASRSPSPIGTCKKFLNKDDFLDVLRRELVSQDWNMFGLISTVLKLLSRVCPDKGSLPESLYDVITQLYRRLNRMVSCLDDDEFVPMHLLMYELGEPAGEEHCLRRHAMLGWKSRETGLRFLWVHARTITDQDLKLAYLETLADALLEEEVFNTATGILAKLHVQSSLEKYLKDIRANSIKALREANLWETIVFIAENDLDLATTNEEEMREILAFWMESLRELKRNSEIVELCTRFIHHVLGLTSAEQNENDLELINDWMADVTLYNVSNEIINSFCYLLCTVTSLFPNNWKMWINLHKGLKELEARKNEVLSYPASLNSDDNSDQLPLHSLDVLQQAHINLGEDQCCTVDKGAFLIYYLKQFQDVIRNEDLMKLISSEKHSFLWTTMSEEIAQLLNCLFGRYCKKRKNTEDHGPYAKPKVNDELANLAIELALPYPIPLFDDKERLGHDVVDLIQTKFASKLTVSPERQAAVENFSSWLKTDALKNIDNNSDWPRSSENEPIVQTNVWYVMALHFYRQNNIENTIKYTKLFLTSSHATIKNRLTLSGWAMLAHSTMSTLLSAGDNQMLACWEWSTVPYKIAISLCESIPILHFQLGSGLYQMSTVMSRAIEKIPEDDIRMKRVPNIEELRNDSRAHFEFVAAQSQTTDESCWLSLFFLGKLAAKSDSSDIIKVVDYIYEAACACELGGFYYYPAKINSKKQQYIEPVELHYQVHSYVWKWLSRGVTPSESTLIALLGYLRAFKSHKVVRSTSSLFTSLPDVHSLMVELTNQIVVQEETDKSQTSSDSMDDLDISLAMGDVINRNDLIEEIWDLCFKGFELVVDRFPHMKASYRLAEMELSRGNIQKGADHLNKGVFRRRKKDDGYFDSIVEITSPDIDRTGSFIFHCDRAADLMIRVLHRQKDITGLIQMIQSIAKLVNESNSGILTTTLQRKHLNRVLQLFKMNLTATNMKTARQELVRLFQYINKLISRVDMLKLYGVLKKIVEPFTGSVDEMITTHLEAEEHKKRMQRKRKMTTYDLSAQAAKESRSEPAPRAVASIPATFPQSLPPMPATDADCQIIEDPAVLMQRAMMAASGLGG